MEPTKTIASDALAQITLPDVEGTEHKLGDLWSEHPVVFCFVRHFGCIFCRAQASELDARADEIESRGGRLIIIGNGAAHFASAFAEDLKIRSTILIDEDRRSYREAGMRRGFVEVLSPKVPLNALRSYLDGHRQKAVQGDAFQLGGVLIIAPGNKIGYEYISETGGDHPDTQEVLNALEKVSSAGQTSAA